MKAPNITRRDLLAALVGAALLALASVVAGVGPRRYQVAALDRGISAYVLDTWTGRVWLWEEGDEVAIRSIAARSREERSE